MAVQSSFYIVDGSTRTFPSTKHIATKQHCAIYLKDKVSLLWSAASIGTYSLINNSIVFDIAPSSASYSDIEVRVADTQDELVDLPSDTAIVASNIADVQLLATNMDGLNSIGDNIDALLVIPANLTGLTNISDNIVGLLTVNESADAAIANANICASIYDQFDDRYLGSKATAPTVDNDGNALITGALYFDTTTNLMKVYGSSGWVSAGSSVNGTTERHTYTATAGQTSFSVNYESGYVDVYLNGSKLQLGVDFTATSGTSIILTSSANVGDIIDIIAYGVFELSTAPTKDVVAYTVNTVADLASVPSSYTTVIVKDLDRGGTFIWSSTGTANDGTVFAGATGYWNRQYDGAVNAKWFGAKGDGITNDVEAIQNAINFAKQQLEGTEQYPIIKTKVFISNGTFNVSSTIYVYRGITLEGESSATTKIKHIGTGACISTDDLETSSVNIKIRNITITGTSTTTYGIKLKLSYRNSIIENVIVSGCQRNIYSEDSWTLNILNCDLQSSIYDNLQIKNGTAMIIEGCRIDGAGSNNIYIDRSTAEISVGTIIRECQIQRANQSGIYLSDVDTAYIESCFFEANDVSNANKADIWWSEGATTRGTDLVVSNCFASNVGNTTNTGTRFIYANVHGKIRIFGCRNYHSAGLSPYSAGIQLGSYIDDCQVIGSYINGTSRILTSSTTTGLYDEELGKKDFRLGANSPVQKGAGTDLFYGFDAPVDKRCELIFKSGGTNNWFAGRGKSTELYPNYFYISRVSGVTTEPDFKINPSTGEGSFNKNLTLTGGAWNTAHLIIGINHLWVDVSGKLRIKSSAPTSDTDGTVVGTQV